MTHPPKYYDLILFGATGFVGKIVCKYLLAHSQKENFRWAIAGRSSDKLQRLQTSLGKAADELGIVVADSQDYDSLVNLCQQTKVVITTVGPYALYGENLVKACAETGTDYCDLTGEVQWVRRMLDKYGAIAEASGARIIHCCGFDSIPSDLGVYFLQQKAQEKFGEPCLRIKMRVKDALGGVSGGTAASGVNLVKEARNDGAVQKLLQNPHVLCPDPTPRPNHPPTLIPVQVDHSFGEWVAPFVMGGINTPIVLRSNALGNYADGKKFQYDEGMLTGAGGGAWFKAQGLQLVLNALGLMAAIAPALLEKIIPAPGEGPSETEQEQGFYDLRFWGETASGETLFAKVTGDRDPGYGSTAKILAQAGLCLALDLALEHCPGGFWTPATIFGDRLIVRLVNYAGLTFDIMDGE